MAKAKNDPYIWGTGRRKTAVARVRLKAGGNGKIFVNKRKLEDYFPDVRERQLVKAPLLAARELRSYDVFINAKGGGMSGQAGAISLGIARALLRANDAHEAVLREGKFLTRDAREKERKKYGLAGARRSFQFSKR